MKPLSQLTQPRTCPRKQWTLVGSLSALITAALMVLTIQQPALAQNNTTVLVGIEARLARIDPHASTTWNTFRVVRHIFEGFVEEDLTRADVERPPIVPGLAKSWDISEDRKTYTFHLREDVQFHDGTQWNAQAARFNMDRMTDPDFKYHQPIAEGLMRWMWQDLKSYEVVDDYTFRIHLKQPVADFLRRLAAGGSGSPRMVSPAAIKKYGNEGFENHLIGTGPYKFVEQVVGEKTVLARNEKYWNPERRPKIDRLIIRPIPEVSTRHLAVLTGQVDMIASPSPDNIESLKTQGMKIKSGLVPTLNYLYVNFEDPVLKDAKVRRAVCMAIDREGLVKFQRNGFGRPATGILNYGGPGYDPEFQDCEYNPEGAKKLLAEAGYPDGFETRIDWTLGGGGDVNYVGDAEWIQRDLAKVGIDAEIETFENSTYWDMLGSGMRDGTGFMAIPWGETSFFWLDQVVACAAIPPDGFNTGHYCNERIDTLLDKARAAPSRDDMVSHLREVQQIIADDMAFVPLYTPKMAYAMRPEVEGFVLAPQHWHDFTQLSKQ